MPAEAIVAPVGLKAMEGPSQSCPVRTAGAPPRSSKTTSLNVAWREIRGQVHS